MAENRYRSAEFELREGDNGAQIMSINFARFGEWTEIRSHFEGHFMERMAPGAFAKTLKERTPQVLYSHGRDPQIGEKPLGKVLDVREQKDGVWADVELLDATYARDIASGLKAGVYGASFAFQAVREDVVQEPKRSDHNPNGIPERTVTELKIREFGPTPFPAYEGTSAGIRSRSLTDDVLDARALSSQPLVAPVEPTAEAEEKETSDENEQAPVEEKSATPDPIAEGRRRHLELMAKRRRDAGR